MANGDLEQRVRPLLMHVDTHITLDKVILSDENKHKIDTFVKENKEYRKLVRYGLQPMNRLLFYGDSGTGKTFLGKALSNYLDYRMLYIDIAASLSGGDVADNLHTIFEYANLKEECLIFLDECDSIAWNRDAKSAEGGLVRRATNSLFQLMDQMKPNVVIICATNLLHRLDPAFERRFNMKMEFRRPKTNLTEDIKFFLFPQFTLDIDTKDEVIEKRASGRLSYYEIQGLTERAMKKAVLEDRLNVKLSDIYSELAGILRIKRKFKTDISDVPDDIDDDADIDL